MGANQLQSVTSPVAGASGSDIVTYSYDALNRVVGFTINGTTRVSGVGSSAGPTAARKPAEAVHGGRQQESNLPGSV